MEHCNGATPLDGTIRQKISGILDKEIRWYVDLIDDLRKNGLEQDIDLPSVVVIGDQSSGKSSILEAISGVPLPRGKQITTRCPLELQCKRVSTKPWNASLSYLDRKNCNPTREQIEQEIRKAQDALAGPNKGVSLERITLRIESSDSPDLSLIDLPGIARTPQGGQSEKIYSEIVDLINTYIRRKNVIILCVIDARVDLAVNEVFQLSKVVDPEGFRTIGVITKPDIVEEEHKTEVLDILNNKKYPLKKGFFMVKCRSQGDIDKGLSLDDAVHNEKETFSNDRIYRQANSNQLGIENLAQRLSTSLVELIKSSLPSLRCDVERLLRDTSQLLTTLPKLPPTSDSEKLTFVTSMIYDFIKQAQVCLQTGDTKESELHLNTPECSGDQESNASPSRAGDEKIVSTKSLFYAWRKAFEEFREAIEIETKKQMKLVNGAFSEKTLQKRLEDSRGRELPPFLDYSVFEAVIKEHLARYDAPANLCMSAITSNLATLMRSLVNKWMYGFPQLKEEIWTICEAILQEQEKTGKQQMKFIFDMESLMFTQDKTYKQSYASVQQQEVGTEIPKEPIRFRNMIQAYLEVVNRRLADNLPSCLRICLHLNYAEVLKDRLLIKLTQGSDDLVPLVTVDDDVARTTDQLVKKEERLKKAISKINSVY